MRKALFFLCLTLAACIAISCSKDKKGPEAYAIEYYTALINNDYAAYADGMEGKKSLPADYREQFINLSRQYANKLNKTHSGLDTILVSKCMLNKDEDMANVFLELCFNDSTKEAVVVPMVKKDNLWLMK